ncbi:hypothetical protein FDP41_004510 [Naegleria fowleri]|uniref:Major facilitator superfamily (MFS) profile domain-containing protein n=1 Tax=Naegleria fowleri TaxID=5763 RepID=A0A6A5BQT3_NAEFO|nr:uncharacterized protein FDP41_004510 [Naegleria fowleri]KAF0976611.1 hypothetical protein FDP41_004510 [Naegleria fowleri]
MKNPIQSFYQLSWVQKYENYLKSKRVILSFLLIFTNLLAGIVYGYALGSIGAAFTSASAAFPSTSSTTTNNTLSSAARFILREALRKHEVDISSSFQNKNTNNQDARITRSDDRPISSNLVSTSLDYYSPIHDLKNEISPLLMTSISSNVSNPNTTSTTNFDLGNSLLQGLFASSIFIGGFGGAMFVMLFGNYLGRKLCMILCCVVFSIGCIGASASNSYASLIVFRCIMGFGAAISTSVCSVYMAELMPFSKYQGVLGAMYNMGIATGLSIAYVIGAIFTGASSGGHSSSLIQKEQWRAVHAFGNLFSLLLLFLIVCCIPESPLFVGSSSGSSTSEKDGSEEQNTEKNSMVGTWNISHETEMVEDPSLLKMERDRISQSRMQALNSTATTTATTTTTSTTLSNTQVTAAGSDHPSKDSNDDATPHHEKKMPILKVLKRLFCSKVIIATLLASYYCFAIEWTGIQSATLFTPSLLESAGVKEPLHQLLCSFAINVWQVLTNIPIIFLVDRFGRKTILLFGLTVSVLTDLAEGFIFQFATDGSTEKIVLALVFMAIYLVGFNIGLGSLTFILAHEVFNGEHERVVVLGTSMATMCLWIFSIILSLFFIPVVAATNQAVPWFIFAGFSFIGLLLSVFLLKETSPFVLAKHKTKEEAKKEKELKLTQTQQEKEEKKKSQSLTLPSSSMNDPFHDVAADSHKDHHENSKVHADIQNTTSDMAQ